MLRFVNITEAEFLSSKLLYKHMPLENALRTLNNKALWFANPATWPDPFERRFLEATYVKGGKETTFNWIERVFCTCMTQTSSSEAFWNAYSKGEIVIEFRIIREKLLEDLKRNATKYDIFIGKAGYTFMRLKFVEEKPVYSIDWKDLVAVLESPVIKQLTIK